MSRTAFSYLPPVVHRYIRFPPKFAVAWLVLVTGFVMLPRVSYTPPVETSPDSTYDTELVSKLDSRGTTYSATGTWPLSITVRDSQTSVKGVAPVSGEIHVIVDGAGSKLVFAGMSTAVAASLRSQSNPPRMPLEILDNNDIVQYRLNGEDGEYALRDPQGNKIFRIKVKEEKFNIYDSKGVRLLHGKEKKGSILVRTESDSEVMRISIDSSVALDKQLTVSGFLALELPGQYRALLAAWAAG